MRRRPTLALLIVGLLLVPTIALADPPPGGSFLDDDTSLHEAAIEAIAAERITRGCNPPANDRFCPEGTVTRGQMAAFLARGLALTDTGTADFVDVPPTHLFRTDILRLATAGITRGCNPPANDRFCPEEPVTRGEMAAFIVRSVPTPPPGEAFVDVPADHVFHTDVRRLAAAGITRGCNPPANDRYCPDAPITREQMATMLARALELAIVPVPDRSQLSATQVGSGLGGVTWIGGLPGDDRLFAAELDGRVRVVGATPGATILDLRDEVSLGGERGLLGMAVHPSGDGRVVVAYTDPAGTSRIVEYQWDGSTLGSPRLILSVPQPATTHNGGGLAFDDDGLLYVSLGDGGGAGDPWGNGQDTSTLLGSILRVDITGDDYPGDATRNYRIPAANPFADGDGGDPAIWLWGVRNAWRIDLHDGHLYVADVGQDTREEVNVVPVSGPGGDLGWNRLEGTHCYTPSAGCSTEGTILPVVEHPHPDACSITGGVVFRRGPADIVGTYLYADFCRHWFRTFRHADGVATQQILRPLDSLRLPTTFGIGPDDHTYVGTRGGQVWRIAP